MQNERNIFEESRAAGEWAPELPPKLQAEFNALFTALDQVKSQKEKEEITANIHALMEGMDLEEEPNAAAPTIGSTGPSVHLSTQANEAPRQTPSRPNPRQGR